MRPVNHAVPLTELLELFSQWPTWEQAGTLREKAVAALIHSGLAAAANALSLSTVDVDDEEIVVFRRAQQSLAPGFEAGRLKSAMAARRFDTLACRCIEQDDFEDPAFQDEYRREVTFLLGQDDDAKKLYDDALSDDEEAGEE